MKRKKLHRNFDVFFHSSLLHLLTMYFQDNLFLLLFHVIPCNPFDGDNIFCSKISPLLFLGYNNQNRIFIENLVVERILKTRLRVVCQQWLLVYILIRQHFKLKKFHSWIFLNSLSWIKTNTTLSYFFIMFLITPPTRLH